LSSILVGLNAETNWTKYFWLEKEKIWNH